MSEAKVVSLSGEPVTPAPEINAEAIEQLERALEAAKRGDIYEYAIVFCDQSSENTGFKYSINHHGLQLMGQLRLAMRKIEDRYVEKWEVS